MGGWAVLLFVAYLSFGTSYYWLTRILRSDSPTSWLDRGLLLLLTIRRWASASSAARAWAAS